MKGIRQVHVKEEEKKKKSDIHNKDWPEPRKVKDIQSFLGFANIYMWYIHNYSDIVVPLTHLTRKNIPWTSMNLAICFPNS
jgi:hypothetical protein